MRVYTHSCTNSCTGMPASVHVYICTYTHTYIHTKRERERVRVQSVTHETCPRGKKRKKKNEIQTVFFTPKTYNFV